MQKDIHNKEENNQTADFSMSFLRLVKCDNLPFIILDGDSLVRIFVIFIDALNPFQC